MAAQVISLAQRLRPPPVRDWSAQEMAEFYRVESALLQAGLALESERGLSDEGDPWFCFCRQDTGEVFIHFARVDGQYVVDGAALGAPARGRDFGALVRDLIGQHPLSAVRRPQGNVHLHPAALLIALVGAAFFQSGHAKAAEAPGHDGAAAAPAKAEGRRGPVFNVGAAPISTFGELGRTVALDPAEVAAILTGVAIGLRQVTAEAASTATPQSAPSALQSFMAHAAPAPESISAVGGRASTTLSTLSGAETRAALTVVAAFTDLARLKIAAAALASEAPAPAAVMDGAHPALAAPPVVSPAPSALAAPEPAPPRPLLLVTLAEGPLPQIAAVALAIADGAFAKIDASRVVHVETLPAILGSLLLHGEIVEVAAPPTLSPAAVAAPPALPPSPADPAHDGGHASPDPGQPVEHAWTASPPAYVDPRTGDPVQAAAPGAGGTQVALATPAPAPVEPPKAFAPPPPVMLDYHDPKIDAYILDFVTKVARAAVVVSDHEVVFYDPHIIEVLKPGETLDSITWKLGDGSSVSIVGLATDLHAYHGVG